MNLLRLALGLLLTTHIFADQRFLASLDDTYQGQFGPQVLQNKERVRLLMRQAQLDVSVRLGLIQYRDGFQYPMAVGFADSAPAGIENALAYVMLSQRGDDFRQELRVNMPALMQSPAKFDEVFYHEMTHAVMNDLLGGNAAAKLPPWVQEGLAMYASQEGESRLRAVATYPKEQRRLFVVPLNGPYTGNSYPQYYLAIKFIVDRSGVSGLQNFVRFLAQKKPVEQALFEAISVQWPQFETELRAYSLQKLESL